MSAPLARLVEEGQATLSSGYRACQGALNPGFVAQLYLCQEAATPSGHGQPFLR